VRPSVGRGVKSDSRPGFDASVAVPHGASPKGIVASMDISIIIASYNTRDLLAVCLRSIFESQEPGEIEVFVVDNNSADGSADLVRRDFPAVRLLTNEKNLGFAKANNRALELARGRYLLLLNPDTVVAPHILREMRDLMDARADVGVAGVKLIRQDGRMDEACRRGFPTPLGALAKFTGLHRIFPKFRSIGSYNITYRDPNGEYEVDSIVGAFMFLRRAVLDEVGPLDESFFMFGEDLDWCYRIKQRNWKVLYVGSKEVMHVKGASTRQAPKDMNAHFHRAMMIFYKKHLDQHYPFFVNWVIMAGIRLRWAAKAVLLHRRSRAIRAQPLVEESR
jgi:GT2 family glycosyltransferase